MLENENKWILPENLLKQQERDRNLVDEGKFDGGGDFGSYYGLRKGINDQWIKPHAVSDEKEAKDYVQNIKVLCEFMELKLKGTFVDMDCGLGVITNAFLKETGVDKAIGIDISEDAIEYAKQKYPNCRFYCQSADNLDNFADNSFDVIHCKGFTPFVRTNDEQYHLKFIDIFSKKLKKGGLLIISFVEPQKYSLANVLPQIKDDPIYKRFCFCGKFWLSQKLVNRFKKFVNVIYSFPLYNILHLGLKFRRLLFEEDKRLEYVYFFKKL